MSKSRLDEYLESPGPQSTPDLKKQLEPTRHPKLQRWSESNAYANGEQWGRRKQDLLSESEEHYEGGKLQRQNARFSNHSPVTVSMTSGFESPILDIDDTAQESAHRSQTDLEIEIDGWTRTDLLRQCQKIKNLFEVDYDYRYRQKSNFGQVVAGWISHEIVGPGGPRRSERELLCKLEAACIRNLKAAPSSPRPEITDSEYNNHKPVPVPVAQSTSNNTLFPTSGLP
jgi:hypothetical protein